MNTVYKIEVHQEAVVGPCKAIAPQSPLKFLERSPHLVLFFAGIDVYKRQDVSKEWLDFRRNQFPAGSRIQTWELDDPRNTLKEARKLDYIDDSGRFHVRQSDGGECVLTLGEEMFSVHPPESTQLKLYMPCLLYTSRCV